MVFRATLCQRPACHAGPHAKKFWFYMLDIHEKPARTEPSQGKPLRAIQAGQTISLRPNDFAALAALTPEELQDVNLVIYHKWDNTRRFIDRLDTQTKSLVTSGRAMQTWNVWEKDTPFILENFRSALDAPGEWFLARDGMLYYKPLPGEDMTTAEVIAPAAEKFIVISGDPAAEKWVEHVTLQGACLPARAMADASGRVRAGAGGARHRGRSYGRRGPRRDPGGLRHRPRRRLRRVVPPRLPRRHNPPLPHS